VRMGWMTDESAHTPFGCRAADMQHLDDIHRGADDWARRNRSGPPFQTVFARRKRRVPSGRTWRRRSDGRSVRKSGRRSSGGSGDGAGPAVA
jgi:hypothetical protein